VVGNIVRQLIAAASALRSFKSTARD